MSEIKLRQKTTRLEDIYADAEEGREELENILLEACGKAGGDAMVPADLKKRGRAEEKIKNDYHGDASCIMDVLRARGVCRSLEQADAMERALEKTGRVRLVRDRLRKPLAHGYRNRVINIELSNGHIAEIQIRLGVFQDLEAETHETYRQIREIEAQDKQDPRLARLYLGNIRRYEEATMRYNATTKGEKLPLTPLGKKLLAQKTVPGIEKRAQSSLKTPKKAVMP